MINNLTANKHAVGQDSETESTEHCTKYTCCEILIFMLIIQ